MVRKMDARQCLLHDGRQIPACPNGAGIQKEGAMRNVQGQISEWISHNRQNLIHCPNQPGNLLISKQSCQRRRKKARQEDLADAMKGDVMDYIYRQGLSICLACDAMKRKAA